MSAGVDICSVISEFAGVELGDLRRKERLVEIVKAFVAAPDNSFPEMMRSSAELEAFYRFVNNESFTFEDLTRPHCQASAERVAKADEPVLVVHDATEYSFPFDEDLREGCEKLGRYVQGFYGSVSLALASDSLEPLGLLHSQTWTKKELNPKRPHQKRAPKSAGRGPGRISGSRWAEFIEGAEGSVSDRTKLIHIIDREADGFPLYASLIGSDRRFVIRVCGARNVELSESAGELIKLSEAAQRATPVSFESVELSRRPASKASKQHPPRGARSARLAYAAMPVTIHRGCRPDKSLPETLSMHVVCVREVNTPRGEEPIEWLLATNEPIETPEQVRAIVSYYRARWRIEEFFRALKTGCAFEKRQLESRDALLHVLAISQVVAWHVMRLRHVSRASPNEPASSAFSPLTLFVLRATGRVRLRPNATVQEALYAVAALGGHIKNNGYPGLTTLSRGMEHLLERSVSFLLMLQVIGGLGVM